MTRRMYLAGLIATWDNRDDLYGRRTVRVANVVNGEEVLTREPFPLSPAEREAIRAWRRKEAEKLTEPERGLALQVLREWTP